MKNWYKEGLPLIKYKRVRQRLTAIIKPKTFREFEEEKIWTVGVTSCFLADPGEARGCPTKTSVAH